MKPPKCKVCGHEHYGTCFSSGSALASQRIIVDDPGYHPAAAKKLRSAVAARIDEPGPAITVRSRLQKPKRGRPISDKPKSPRAEYQRDLMRKRRSKP